MADAAGTFDSVPIPSLYQSNPVFYLGPILLASELDCILLGCVFIQAWSYFGTFKKDALKFKMLVGWMVLLNCGQSATTIAFTFATFVRHFGDWFYVPLEPWITVIVLESFAAGLSQIFFFSRAWALATRRGQILLCACFLTIPASFALGIASAAEMALAPGGTVVNFDLLPIFNILAYTWKAVCIFTDLLLTATIIYYLRRSTTGIHLASTRRLVSRLSRHTFESQLLPLLASLFLLITNAQDVNSNLVLFGSFGDTKLCCCSILHCLNSRKRVRQDLLSPQRAPDSHSFVSPLGAHKHPFPPTSSASHEPTSSFPDPPSSGSGSEPYTSGSSGSDDPEKGHDGLPELENGTPQLNFQDALEAISRPATPIRERAGLSSFWRC